MRDALFFGVLDIETDVYGVLQADLHEREVGDERATGGVMKLLEIGPAVAVGVS